jgi:hypothetical protein
MILSNNSPNIFVSLLEELKIKNTFAFSNKHYNEYPYKYSLCGYSNIPSGYLKESQWIRIEHKKNVSTHTEYYDKKKRRIYISSTSDFRKLGYTINGITETFHPIYINGNKEMIEPKKLLKHKVITNSKYESLFLNIQEDDNPIIIIAKLKNAD